MGEFLRAAVAVFHSAMLPWDQWRFWWFFLSGLYQTA